MYSNKLPQKYTKSFRSNTTKAFVLIVKSLIYSSLCLFRCKQSFWQPTFYFQDVTILLWVGSGLLGIEWSKQTFEVTHPEKNFQAAEGWTIFRLEIFKSEGGGGGKGFEYQACTVSVTLVRISAELIKALDWSNCLFAVVSIESFWFLLKWIK